jgi:hypothetical protein
MESVAEQDTHFYIDYAPPNKVRDALWCLKPDNPMLPTEIFDRLESQGKTVSQRTEIPRRLFDLGLAEQVRHGNRIAYTLTSLGSKLREIASFDPGLYPDLIHFLHFSSWDGTPQARKFLWSYRQCSEISWMEELLLPGKQLASRVQSRMMAKFPDLDYAAAVGARFDSTAAGRWSRWVQSLKPPPFEQDNGDLQKRAVKYHEIILLALDDVYRFENYRYGDPVILDEEMIDELARVFFLDPICCRELLDLAAAVTKAVKLSDTFAGTSVSLVKPYTIESI